jgi:hypothetical protein
VKYFVFLLCAAAQAQLIGTLKPETARAFDAYQATVDQELKERIAGRRAFQWSEEHPDLRKNALAGQLCTFAITGHDGRSVPGGLVHDWVGVTYLRGRRLDEVRAFLLDTARHPAVFSDVRQANVLSRGDSHSVTRMLLVKKRIITVTLDIEYQNDWRNVSADRWTMNARSRRVSELDNGTPLAPDTGHGFLWRMNTCWLLAQDEGGTWVELRSVTLSRDTPSGLGWIIKPLIRNFPAEAIMSTLEGTRKALRH